MTRVSLKRVVRRAGTSLVVTEQSGAVALGPLPDADNRNGEGSSAMNTATEDRVTEGGAIVGLEARLVDDLKILRAAFRAAGISFENVPSRSEEPAEQVAVD